MTDERLNAAEESHVRRALLTEAIQARDDGGGFDCGPIGKYLVNDPDLNNIAQGVGLLICPSKAERSFRPDTLGAHAHEIYRRWWTEEPCDQCIDPFLRACWNEPCFYTAIRDVCWPRTAFLIGENLVVTARHSLPIGLDLLTDVRVIFGLTYDKLRIDVDDQKLWTVAKYKPGTYKAGSGRYDWATFEIELITPNRGPLKPTKPLVNDWISKLADDDIEHNLAMLGHPLGLPLTLVRNKSKLRKVLPPGGERQTALPKGLLIAEMDSIDGYSGAPVLTQANEKWQIVGLCVGTDSEAADPNVRKCPLSAGNVVDHNDAGRCRILPAEDILKSNASPAP